MEHRGGSASSILSVGVLMFDILTFLDQSREEIGRGGFPISCSLVVSLQSDMWVMGGRVYDGWCVSLG